MRRLPSGWGGGWRDRNSSSVARRQRRRWRGLEPLESRYVLSISSLVDPPVQQIVWQGQTVEAYAGRWIVGVDQAGLDGAAASNGLLNASTTRSRPVETFLAPRALQLVDNWLESHTATSTLDVLRGLGTSDQQRMFQVNAPAGLSFDEMRASLGDLPGFRYVEPDFVLSAAVTTPNDPLYSTLYGMNNTGQTGGVADADIDAPEAWDLTTGSHDVVVGVIDSGVDYTHPDLAANIWVNPGEIAGDGIDNDGNGFIDDIHGWDFANDDNDPMDDNNHGTHVSGTIGGVGNNGVGVVGVNWNVQIMALKYLNAEGHGSTSNAVDALNYATMMRRDHGINIRLTSNSWGGGGFSQSLYNAIAASGEQDMLFIAAAGNGEPDGIGDDNDSVPFYPATYDLDNIISVAATDSSDNKAGFSNFGATTVDLAAPGVSVRSTIPGNSYANFNGTSMATPHVAGVAALAWSLAPSANYQTIRDAIFGGVDPIPAMDGISVTGGRLNAFGTLKQLGMRVTSMSPAQGSVVTDLRTDFAVNFSNPYVLGSIDASDLTINGLPADSYTLTDADTVTFHYNVSPISSQGLQNVAIAEGAITRTSDSAQLNAYTGTFRYDVLPLAVVAMVPPNGTTAQLPISTIQMQFNEAFDPSTVSIDDVAISQGTITGFNISGNSVTYNVSGLLNEGVLSISMKAGALADMYGNPLVAFAGSVTLDFGIVPFPTPLTPLSPDGSLVYDPAVSGSIGTVGDLDSFTLDLIAGQRLSVAVDPAASLRPVIEVRDPSDVLVATVTASGNALEAVLQSLAISTTGTYRITVGGSASTIGNYTNKVTLNAALEAEQHDGASNNTLATAQSLNSAFSTIGGQATVAGVVGRTDAAIASTLPAEIESNGTTGTANSAAYNFTGYSNNLYQLAISGNITASDSDYFAIGALQVSDVLTLAVSGSTSSRGTLANPIVELYRGNAASPTLVTSDDNNGPGNEPLVYRFSIANDDNYYIRVRPSSLTGTYQLAAWLENVGTAPNTGGSLTSETESNNTAATANDASSSWRAVNYLSQTTGTMSTVSDNDFFSYTFTAGDVVTILADSTSTLDARVALLNSAGTVIASEDGNSVGPGADSPVYAYRIATTGTYYVRVQARLNSGAYTANVYLSTTTPPPAPVPNDWYSFDLTAGQRASLVLKNQVTGNLDLTLTNALGTTLATGNTTATNADEYIQQFVAPSTGTYYAKITGAASQTYNFVVARDAAFNTEPNDSPGGTLVDLTNVHTTLGFLDINRPTSSAPVSFVLDNATSIVTIGGMLYDLPFEEQQPGSLTTHYQGTIKAILQPGTIQFSGGGSLDADAHPGPFLPGNVAADYAGKIQLGPSLYASGIFRDLVIDAVSGVLPVSGLGEFDAAKLTTSFTTGQLDYDIPGFTSGTFPLAGVTAANDATDPATLEEINGVLYLTIPVQGSDSIIEPSTGLQFDVSLTGTLHASYVLPPPIDPDDYYEVTLAPGETLAVWTETPLDTPSAARLNTLDAALEVLDGGNAIVASDTNSAGDGKNAAVEYYSAAGGTFKIHVSSTAGKGEYVLHTSITANHAPVLGPVGNKVVNEGSVLSFTALADDVDLDQLTFSLGPGAPAGASIHPTSGLFTWTAPDNAGSPFSVTIVVTDNGNPLLSDSETISITVNNVAPTANAGGPYSIQVFQQVQLIGSGTDPVDTLTYSWDVNGDGIYGDATGQSPTLSWTQLQALGITASSVHDVRVQVSDGTDSTTSAATTLTVGNPAAVVGRAIFYNNSKFDGNGNNGAGISTSDDLAIATDKSAYLPGGGTSTFANMTSYNKGINGVIIDLTGPHAVTLSASDFIFRVGNNNTPNSWAAAPTPAAISIRPGAGTGGSDRVEITWADGAIKNQWLEVIVNSGANTGLLDLPGFPVGQGDAFFFGNKIGNVPLVAGGDSAAFAVVGANDQLEARGHLGIGAQRSNLYDFDRNKVVDSNDELIARGNAGNLRFIAVASPPLAPSDGGAPTAEQQGLLAALDSDSLEFDELLDELSGELVV